LVVKKERAVEGVRLGKDELVRTYGISQRLAVRVGALLANGLEVTGTLLEIAGPGSPVEKLLLRPEMLAAADQLTVEAVRKAARESGAAAEGEFALAESSTGGRVLALEEEILSQEGFARERVEKAPTAIARAEEGFAAMPVLDRKEARGLFNAEEVARLKLEALAGRDAEARVSALRKLVFAPISAHEKGAIYLRALLDPAGPVRSEAMTAIESLGFNRDMADAIQSLFRSQGRARRAALRRIGDLLRRLNPAERKIALAVVLESFRESKLTSPNDPLFLLLDEAGDALAENPEIVPELARVCIQHLLAEPARLGEALRDRLARLAAAAPGPVLEKVWEEIATVSEPAPRALLLGLLIESEQVEETAGPSAVSSNASGAPPSARPIRPEERQARLCEVVAQELLRQEPDEVTRQKLGHRFVRLGLPALRAILRKFAAASNPDRAALVQFLDAATEDPSLPPEERNQAARQLLEALKIADGRLREQILNTRIFAHPGVSPELRRDAAQELLPLLRIADHPETSDRAAGLLEALGPAAAQGLFDLVRKRPNAPEADVAVRILGRILAANPTEGLVPQAYEFLSQRVAAPGNVLGGCAAALGLIASSPAVSDEDARKALDLLLGRLGRVRWHGDLVEAIGRIGARAGIPAEQRVQVSHLLGRIIERPSKKEDAKLREVQTARGRVYEVTGRIEFDSETLPAAVRGLEEVAVSPATTPALRRQIAVQLLRVWEGVAGWTVIWGPRASEALARALGRIGADPGSDDETRAQVLQGLMLGIERPSVVRALCAVCATPATSPKAARLGIEAGDKILDQWMKSETNPDERQAALTAAAAAACRPEVPARNPQARKLRERVCELLLDALRAEQPWARTALEKMRDSSVVAARLRKEIAGRLDPATSVLRLPPLKKRGNK